MPNVGVGPIPHLVSYHRLSNKHLRDMVTDRNRTGVPASAIPENRLVQLNPEWIESFQVVYLSALRAGKGWCHGLPHAPNRSDGTRAAGRTVLHTVHSIHLVLGMSIGFPGRLHAQNCRNLGTHFPGMPSFRKSAVGITAHCTVALHCSDTATALSGWLPPSACSRSPGSAVRSAVSRGQICTI
jgi:hypothetical protein